MALRLTLQRTLHLTAASGPGRGAFISAASGLVVAGPWLYVVADDELHLGVFPAKGTGPGRLVRLFSGELPRRRTKRKARKPDLEVLTRLPPGTGGPEGGLLGLGSGSRPGRGRGFFLPLRADGGLGDGLRVLDLTGLYEGLPSALGRLNVEGAVVRGAHLCLLNRGQSGRSANALVFLPLRRVRAALRRGNALGPLPCRVVDYALGSVDGVPLGFTDATALADGSLLFTAVAEQTGDSYADGPCRGAAVGLIRPDGALGWLHPVQPMRKVEGIALGRVGSRRQLLLVTDEDDPRVPAVLYAAPLPRRSIPRA